MSVAKGHSLPADDDLNEVDAENDTGQRRRKGGIGKVVKSPAPNLSGVGAFAGFYLGVIVQVPDLLAGIMHRFSSLRSDEDSVTKGRRRRDDKARDPQAGTPRAPQAYSCSTQRSPRKPSAVSVDDCGTVVDNLCIISANFWAAWKAASQFGW